MNLAQQALKLNNVGRARRLLERHRPQPSEDDLRGWEWRYLWQLTRSSALVTLTTRPTTRGFDVSFSPNATRLAVGWMGGQVDLWDVPARRLLKVLTQGADGPAAHVAFSPVRNLLAATSTNGVTLYDLDSGRESVLLRASKPDWSDVRELSFSPDGSRLVIYAMTREAGNSIAEVCVVEVSSQQIASRHKSTSQFVDYLGYPFFGAARLHRPPAPLSAAF